MEPPSIVLRPVEESDFDMILEWRNNPDVRRNSINSEKIEKIDNRKYWKLRIADKKAISWIAMTKIENEPVGLVRLDQSDRRDQFGNEWEVSIVIKPERQGEGIGSTALAAALAKARDMGIRKVFARIKPKNQKSVALFQKAGFETRLYIMNKEL